MISPQHNRLHLLVEEESTVDHSQTNAQLDNTGSKMLCNVCFFMTECELLVTYKLHWNLSKVDAVGITAACLLLGSRCSYLAASSIYFSSINAYSGSTMRLELSLALWHIH